MITVWGGQTSRSIRVVWVLEEMGLPYRVRQVDMLAAKQDPEFLAVNPADYIPAIQDGDVVMVESIAIMEYLATGRRRWRLRRRIPRSPPTSNFRIWAKPVSRP